MNLRPPTTHPDNRLGATRRAARPRRGWRAGFNFTEVLFAVMILGIGFIMVAAIFPVALQQARVTSDETVAAHIAKGAVAQFEQIALMPPVLQPTTAGGAVVVATPLLDRTDDLNPVQRTQVVSTLNDSGDSAIVIGKVFSLRDNRFFDGPTGLYDDWQRDTLWGAFKGNLILPSDNRYAWVGLYRRDSRYTRQAVENTADRVDIFASPYVQIYVVAVQIRNRTVYEPDKDLRRFRSSDRFDNANSTPGTLEPALLTAKFFNSTTAGRADTIELIGAEVGRVGPGAVVIVSHDRTVTNPTLLGYGRMNGRIYRIGNRHPTRTNVWELAPGNDLGIADPTTFDADVFVVGRSLSDPAQASSTHEGAVQDISVYTSFISAR